MADLTEARHVGELERAPESRLLGRARSGRACETIEQADKLRRVQSRGKGAVARADSAKEKK